MLNLLFDFLTDDTGTASVEYAVVLTLFGLAVIGSFQLFLTESGTQLTNTQTHLQTTALVLPSPAPSP